MDSRRCFDRFDRRICGVQNPPRASMQPEIEAPVEEPAHKVDRPNQIAPIYPSQIPSNTRSADTTPLRKPTPPGTTNPSSKSGSVASGSNSAGNGTGSGNGEGKAEVARMEMERR